MFFNVKNYSDDVDLIILDEKLYHEYACKQGDSIPIPCRPTHPNVTFHLIRNSHITAKGYKWEPSDVRMTSRQVKTKITHNKFSIEPAFRAEHKMVYATTMGFNAEKCNHR